MESKKVLEMPQKIKQVISDFSRKYDKIWIKRHRVFDTQLLVIFIFKLVLGKNKQPRPEDVVLVAALQTGGRMHLSNKKQTKNR